MLEYDFVNKQTSCPKFGCPVLFLILLLFSFLILVYNIFSFILLSITYVASLPFLLIITSL